MMDATGQDWRCECGDLNRPHEAGCYRCGAGRPDVGATGQPYSDAARDAALEANGNPQCYLPQRTAVLARITVALDAAHDREVLGLDASVHAASYRREVIEEMATWLAAKREAAMLSDEAYAIRRAEIFLREFEATEAKP